MILSKYNTITEYNNMIAIFNSLSGEIAIIEKDEWIKFVDMKFEHQSNIIEVLKNKGILVEENTDEQRLAELKYIKKTNDNYLRLTFLPTMLCNFRCKYCYEEHDNETFTENDIDEIIKFIKKHLSEYKGVMVDWFGGEPLLAKDIVNKLSENFIEECRKKGKLYFASMTTNGSLLTPDVFNQMIKNKIFSFHITLDGNKEMHDSMRPFANGGGSFLTVLNNLRYIRDNAASKRFKIIIRSNINKDNIEFINEYIDFLNEEFGADDRFQYYFRPMGDWGGDNISLVKTKIVTGLEDIYEKLLKTKKVINYDFYINLLNNAICQTSYVNSYVITPGSNVLKCTCDLKGVNNKIGIIKNGNMIIDNQKLALWIVRDQLVKEKCTSCKTYANCFGRTCALNSINGMSYSCGYDNKSIDYILKLIIKNECMKNE